MSINSNKIAKFYQQCQQAAQIKRQILFDLNKIIQFPDPIKIQDIQKMCKCQSVKKFWKISHKILNQFKSHIQQYSNISQNVSHIQNVSSIISKIKNTSQCRTKQDALQQQLGKFITSTGEKFKDPLLYYDIKTRQATIQKIQNLIQQINNSRKESQQITKPLYAHKMERQTKNILLQVSLNQCKFDDLVQLRMIEMHITMNKILKSAIQTLKQFNILLRVNNTKNQFLTQNCKIFNQKGKINHKDVTSYFKDLTYALKDIMCWAVQTKQSLQACQSYFSFLIENFSQKMRLFRIKEEDIYKKIRHSKPQVSIVIQVKSLFFLIQASHKYFNLHQICTNLNFSLKKQSDALFEIQLQIKQQLKKLGSNAMEFKTASQLFEHFKSYKLIISKFQKRQRQIYTQVYHAFNYFASDLRQIFSFGSQQQYKVKKIQTNDINKLFNSHLFQANQPILQPTKSFSNQISFQSPLKTQLTKKNSLDNQITPKTQIELAIQLLRQLKIVEFSSEDNKSVNSFSCALGPRLLLNGKMYLHYDGVYYESFFNKKNLFFGKTKMFIPRKQITGINPEVVLGFIPDCIQIQTVKGPLYFHTFGKRDSMINSLSQFYFPESNPQDQQGQFAQQEFYQCSPQSIPPIPTNYSEIIADLNQVIITKKYKNISVKKYFRRYVSDDKFQHQGKQYSNFKIYLLDITESIDPKSSPITPQIPLYFNYKSEVGKAIDINCSKNNHSERLLNYKKKIPKIPFLSNGGQGICEEKQTFHWISPQQFVILSKTTLMGFSLTQNMAVKYKAHYKQQNDDISLKLSINVQFNPPSSTDSLVKGPTIAGVKSMFQKGFEIQQKYQKLMNRKKSKKKDGALNEMDQLRVQVQNLQKQIKYQKRKFWITVFLFIILYGLTVGILLIPSSVQIQQDSFNFNQ